MSTLAPHLPQLPKTSRRASLPLVSLLLLALLASVLIPLIWPGPVGLVAPLALWAGALGLWIAWRWPLFLLGVLLVIIPFYDGVLRYATHVLEWPAQLLRLMSLWREGGLLLLAGVLVVQHLLGRRRIRVRVTAFDLWLLALAALAVPYILVAERPGIGVYGLRNYLTPLALLYLARFAVYTPRQTKLLLAALLAVGAVVAALGIYQARALDFREMIRLGYIDETGNVPYAFRTALRDGFPIPRAVSTTTGPNQFAVYLNFLILVCILGVSYWRSWLRRGVLLALIALYGVTLMLTLSRGGLLALLVSLAVWGLLLIQQHGWQRTLHELRHNRLLLGGLIALVVLGSAGVIKSGFATRVLRGLTGRDPAAAAHQSSMAYSVDMIATHPLGIGLGMVGERALQFSGEAAVEHTESTFLQVGMELGVLGMVLLTACLAALLRTLLHMRSQRHARGDRWGELLATLAVILWAGAIADFIFTPLLQNMLAAGYLWFAAGLALQYDAYTP